jgi:hypothetical protein
MKEKNNLITENNNDKKLRDQIASAQIRLYDKFTKSSLYIKALNISTYNSGTWVANFPDLRRSCNFMAGFFIFP